jgi:hypothetical protein
VQFHLERMLPELEDLENKGIFTKVSGNFDWVVNCQHVCGKLTSYVSLGSFIGRDKGYRQTSYCVRILNP